MSVRSHKPTNIVWISKGEPKGPHPNLMTKFSSFRAPAGPKLRQSTCFGVQSPWFTYHGNPNVFQRVLFEARASRLSTANFLYGSKNCETFIRIFWDSPLGSSGFHLQSSDNLQVSLGCIVTGFNFTVRSRDPLIVRHVVEFDLGGVGDVDIFGAPPASHGRIEWTEHSQAREIDSHKPEQREKVRCTNGYFPNFTP